MRRIMLVRIGLVTTAITLLTPAVDAQPTLPRDEIPVDIEPAVRQEIEALYSTGLVDRANAALRLQRMGDEAVPAVPYLVDLLKDGANDVVQTSSGLTIIILMSQQASDALAAIGAPAVAGLSEALVDPDERVNKTQAARALARIETPAAVEALISALGTENESARKSARSELEDLAGADLGDDPAAWRAWLAENGESLWVDEEN